MLGVGGIGLSIEGPGRYICIWALIEIAQRGCCKDYCMYDPPPSLGSTQAYHEAATISRSHVCAFWKALAFLLCWLRLTPATRAQSLQLKP